MAQIELFVKLKIPDTTAITTLHTLKKMGHDELKKLIREDYYLFEVEGDFEKFSKKIGKVDVLVNANKHTFVIQKMDGKSIDKNAAKILVQAIEDDCNGLLYTLQKRLGLNEIKRMEKGVIWTLEFEDNKGKDKVNKIANELLANVNYQKFKIF